MNRETGNSSGNDDIAALEAEVHKAVEQGQDVREMVRQLVLRRISAHPLDPASLRQVAEAVVRGARSGIRKELDRSAAQTGAVGASLRQAVDGLDVALAQLAEASKLAVQEAAGHAQKFSGEDLARTRRDLESLESLFVETLQHSASAARDAAGDILHDLAEHARTYGSAVSTQLQDTVAVITHQIGAAGRAQAEAGLHLAQATSRLLHQIADGVLTGLADHVKRRHPDGKKD